MPDVKFSEQKRVVLGELDELEKLHTRALESIEHEAKLEVTRLEKELKDSTEEVGELEKELDEGEHDTGLALATLFRSPDGRRLIERAFLADPGRTAMELSYLGADEIRGELSVGTALLRQGVPPLPPPKAPEVTPLRRMPRA